MQIIRCETTHEDSQSGQSLVEFAIGLVMLLILIAGIFDVGRALFTYMAMRDAAQEGAQYGSINPTAGDIDIRTAGASDMIQDLDNAGVIVIGVTMSGINCGESITVRVDYPNFPVTMPLLGSFIGAQTFPISASVTDTILTCQ